MVDVVATDIGMILMDGTLFKSLLGLAPTDRISSGGEVEDDEVDVDEEVGLLRNAATLNAFLYHFSKVYLKTISIRFTVVYCKSSRSYFHFSPKQI